MSASDETKDTPGSNTGAAEPRMVMCVKLKRELPALDAPPWPGELGQRIYQQVSAAAWVLWERRMTMILNEYRLMPFQKEAQQFIAQQMEEYFFGPGGEVPPGFIQESPK
jgi:Fe-S cluster biosynthesis and repair protein YggX